MYSKLI